MIVYTRGKPGKLSVVVSNATAEELEVVRSAVVALKPTKFFVYEEYAK